VGVFDRANLKVKAFYADYDAVADGALIEVANDTDIATTIFSAEVIGRP
jgi:hypothetical protein